jgi:hypothetical protein
MHILMAVLVFAGATSDALASLVCPPPSCPMAAAAEVQPKSCCPEQAEPANACCCEIAPAPDAVVEEPAVAAMAIQLPVLARSEQAISLPQISTDTRQAITSFNDLSPPGASFAPDRGRAPPLI